MRRNYPALSEHDSPPQRGVVYPLHVDTLSRPELVSSLTLRACEQEPSAAWVSKLGRDITYSTVLYDFLRAFTAENPWDKGVGRSRKTG